jgi:hypothetical protein
VSLWFIFTKSKSTHYLCKLLYITVHVTMLSEVFIANDMTCVFVKASTIRSINITTV